MPQSAEPRPVHRGPSPERTLTAIIVGYLLGSVICVGEALAGVGIAMRAVIVGMG